MNREELIEKMLDGYHGAGIKAAETFAPWAEDYKKRMAAALDVAVGELLGEPSVEEWEPAVAAESKSPDYGITMTHSVAKRLIASRRSRYLKPKSARDRVEVKPGVQKPVRWDVFLDGDLLGQWEEEEHADIYAEGIKSGLIQKAKEQSR